MRGEKGLRTIYAAESYVFAYNYGTLSLAHYWKINMANEEHLKILGQGVKAWNKWRQNNQDIEPDLSQADLHVAFLFAADLSLTDLHAANLSKSLVSAANLSGANLSNADLRGADLSKSNLRGANLRGANMSKANLTKADLSGAVLSGTILSESILEDMRLEKAQCLHTVFINVDFSTVKSLETVDHTGRSTVDVDTLFRSGGKISGIFLRGCGVPENLIAALPMLVAGKTLVAEQMDATSILKQVEEQATSSQPIRPAEPQSATLLRDKVFISYSHHDRKWLDKLTDVLHPVRDRVHIWDDSQITPGTKWKDEIQQALATAKAAVLLVTPNFLRSDFITNEELPPLLKAAQEEGVTILWVAVSASLYSQTLIGQYQSINNPAKPLDTSKSASEQNKQLVKIAEEIIKAMNQT